MSELSPAPGSDWKMKIRDRLQFEDYYNSLYGDEKEEVRLYVQQSDPESLGEYLVDRTKHFWIVYHKWYNDFNALDLEEDLGAISVADSDSDGEVDAPVPPRRALTPSDDGRRYARPPAEEVSEEGEGEDDSNDHLIGSSSPESQVRPPSLDLRAPSVDDTPATCSTPAVSTGERKAHKRSAAISKRPSKRLRLSSRDAPRPKKQQDRSRAQRSRVKLPRDRHPDELPETNAHHESFLYPYFRQLPPFDSKTRAVFALEQFKLVDRSANTLVSLLAISRKDLKSGIRLEGLACSQAEATPNETEATPLGPAWVEDHDGSRKVVVAAHDILGLTLSLDGTYIETRLARYLLHRSATAYEELAVEARRLQALYLVGGEHHVLGQNRKGVQRVLDTLNEALATTTGAPSSLEEGLHHSWRSEGSLLALETTKIDREIAKILYEQLPNTPYVTPFVFDLVSRYLFHGMVRTDPNHDASIGAQQLAADEALLQDVQAEVLEFEAGEDATVGVPNTAQSDKRTDSRFILHPGQSRSSIRVYQEAIIDGVLYRADDTVLVMGESPLEAATRQSKAKKTTSSNVEDDEDGVEEGDADAAFEKELRQERASEPSTLSNVTAPWFGRIVYFFSLQKQLFVHIDWFLHLRATPIGKMAHARALVYADHCDSIPADGIIRKIDIKRVTAEEQIPSEGFYYSLFWNKETGAYEDFEPLEDPRVADWTLVDAANVPRCLCCARRSVELSASTDDPEPSKAQEVPRMSVPVWTSPKDSCDFSFEDIVYHCGDLLYITPAATFTTKGDPRRQPFLLAELIAIDDVEDPATASLTPLSAYSKLRVRWLQRFDDLFNSTGSTDPRRLVATNLTAQIAVELLKGKANLLLKSEVLKLATDCLRTTYEATPELLLNVGLTRLSPDEFWCGDELLADDETLARIGLDRLGEPPKKRLKSASQALRSIGNEEASSKLPRCAACFRQRRSRLKQDREAVAFGLSSPLGRLHTLSLYAGADLFGIGLEQGCPVGVVKYAVELEPDVAKACQDMRAETTVYASAVGDFLEAAINKHEVPTARRGPTAPPKQPNVDVILAGAPCQGFSSVNKYKKIDDIRCCEPWVYLACMDHYRPAYSSFENVRAIQHFALPVDAEKGDLLKLLMDGLMRLGYQVRADVYNAASFGNPQIRRRLILTVARRGLPLPASPKATHAYSTSLTGMAKTTYDGGARTHVVKDCHRPHGHAPHPVVTFGAATSDLPPFSFADPFGHVTEMHLSQQRWQYAQPIGFSEEEKRPYEQPLPQSAHQRAARIHIRSGRLDLKNDISSIVLDHVVPPVSEKRASILAHLGVAGEKGKKGNHSDVPEFITDPDDPNLTIALRPRYPPALRADRFTLWWKRINEDDVLTPLRTTINPDGTSHGPRIHPRDARQISIREAARMQGFPDWVQWRDHEEDKLAAQIKMIGNAVPLPLAEALGRELYTSVLTYFDKTKSLKPPPFSPKEAQAGPSTIDRKGKGKARQNSPSPPPLRRVPSPMDVDEDSEDEDSDDGMVVGPSASARTTGAIVIDDESEEEDSDEDSDEEELEMSLVRRRERSD